MVGGIHSYVSIIINFLRCDSYSVINLPCTLSQKAAIVSTPWKEGSKAQKREAWRQWVKQRLRRETLLAQGSPDRGARRAAPTNQNYLWREALKMAAE